MTIIVNRKHHHDSMVKYESNHKCLEAIEFALDGKWDSAHEVVQALNESTWAVWIHAVLHKIEGDESNSRYWYSKLGFVGDVEEKKRVFYESYLDSTRELKLIKQQVNIPYTEMTGPREKKGNYFIKNR